MAATFSQRIATRSRLWWGAPRPGSGRSLRDAAHRLRERSAARTRDDPDDVWRCCASWPRTLVDKWNGREFAARHGCQVPELYWHGSALATPPFESLPDHFVVRPVRGDSGRGVWAVTGGREVLRSVPASPADVRRGVAWWRQRTRLPTPLVVEAFVRSEDGSHRLPPELKCSVFGATVAAVEHVDRSSLRANWHRFYTPAWEPFDDPMHTSLPTGEVREPPRGLEQMLALASRLGAELGTFMRIDFFASDDGCVFNEFSSTPGGGRGFTPYCNELFGALWEEHCPGAI